MKKDFSFWTRWAHIYISMFSFAMILFFAITGITLNHPEAFSEKQTVTQHTGRLNEAWFKTEETINDSKLEIVEHFRKTFAITAAFNDFMVDDSQCTVSFKAPGYAADAFIERTTGEFDLTITSSGLIAMLNDLHKGRDTGAGWKGVIDAAGILMILVSLSGFTMIFFIRYRRTTGLIVLLVGGIALAIVYYFL